MYIYIVKFYFFYLLELQVKFFHCGWGVQITILIEENANI